MQPGQPVQGMAFGHVRTLPTSAHGAGYRRGLVGAFVFGQYVDTTLVAWGFRPRRGHEGVDDGQRLGHGVHATADADQLGVVVLARQLRRFHAPGQRTAGAGDLVGGDLLAVARPPSTMPRLSGSATVRVAAAMQNAG